MLAESRACLVHMRCGYDPFLFFSPSVLPLRLCGELLKGSIMYGSIFWDVPMYAAVTSAERRATASEYTAQRAREEIRQLEARVDKLTMIAAAMWTILKETSNSSDDRLAHVVQQIDLSDGKLDGRVRQDARACPKCGRMVAPRHERCIYCGAEVSREGAFGNVM